MMISKISTTAQGHVYVRLEEDGVFRRYVISPGDDYSTEPPEVQAVCAATHTPEVVAAFKGV